MLYMIIASLVYLVIIAFTIFLLIKVYKRLPYILNTKTKKVGALIIILIAGFILVFIKNTIKATSDYAYLVVYIANIFMITYTLYFTYLSVFKSKNKKRAFIIMVPVFIIAFASSIYYVILRDQIELLINRSGFVSDVVTIVGISVGFYSAYNNDKNNTKLEVQLKDLFNISVDFSAIDVSLPLSKDIEDILETHSSFIKNNKLKYNMIKKIDKIYEKPQQLDYILYALRFEKFIKKHFKGQDIWGYLNIYVSEMKKKTLESQIVNLIKNKMQDKTKL